MKVLVCGGRDYRDREFVFKVLDDIHEETTITEIIHGMAKGADTWANDWAISRFVTVHGYRADWKTYGKAAGPMRNARMLKHGRPNLLVAFPGGYGTANMIKQAQAAGIQVIKHD